MKFVGHMVCFNEADFIEQSIKSVINHLDRLIIFEGSWKEHYEVNGKLRSTDGTLEILDRLQKQYPTKIEIYFLNEKTQLDQRNKLWDYLKEDCVLLLIDSDEVWPKDQLEKLKEQVGDWPDKRSGALPPLCYTVDSLTFVNDLNTYTPIRFPRVWELEKGLKYQFVEPNRILLTNEFSDVYNADFDKTDLNINYFHYSYCHKPKRFLEKKKERMKAHGNFSWELRDGLVQKDGVNFKEFTGKHPETMSDHPLIGITKHKVVQKPELIIYLEQSGIGNLVLSTPMLQAIRQAKPSAHIYVVSWTRAYRILEGSNYLDGVINVESPNALSEFLNKKIDHLIISPVGAIEQVVNWFKPRAQNFYKVNVRTPWVKHEAEYKMSFAKKLGYKGPMPSCSVHIHEYNRDNIKNKFADKIIGINAAYLKSDHWPMKHWGNDKFAQLIDRLSEKFTDHMFAFLGSKNDFNDAEDIFSKMQTCGPIYNLCGQFNDIKDCMALIEKCSFVVGNDGGLSHIASALCVPTYTIFLFTNPIKNKPLGPNAHIIMKPCADRLSCQHGAPEQLLNCKNNGCLDVSVDEVMNLIEKTYN